MQAYLMNEKALSRQQILTGEVNMYFKSLFFLVISKSEIFRKVVI